MKLLLACTSGGHYSTMMGLSDFWLQHNRVWVTDCNKHTDKLSSCEQVYFLPYQGSRDLKTFLRNVLPAIKIAFSEKPDLIISTGASIAVNFLIAAKLIGCRYVYVESISRSKELSLSGKLVYHFCDEFYTQWDSLCHKYPKATFKGYA